MTKLCFSDGDVFVDLILLNILAAYNYLYLMNLWIYPSSWNLLQKILKKKLRKFTKIDYKGQ